MRKKNFIWKVIRIIDFFIFCNTAPHSAGKKIWNCGISKYYEIVYLTLWHYHDILISCIMIFQSDILILFWYWIYFDTGSSYFEIIQALKVWDSKISKYCKIFHILTLPWYFNIMHYDMSRWYSDIILTLGYFDTVSSYFEIISRYRKSVHLENCAL